MRRLRVAVFLLPLLSACESPTGLQFMRVEDLQVAAFQVDCMGVGPQTCLQVRREDTEPWSLFYGGIEGFTHEAGFQYELRVNVFRVRNPPADGSSLTYRLVRELDRVAVPPP